MEGQNPYLYSPEEAYYIGILEDKDPLIKHPEKSLDQGPWNVDTLSEHINYPYVRTIYPPLGQYLFGLSQWISPWDLWGWRLMIFVAEIFTMIALCLTLKGMA